MIFVLCCFFFQWADICVTYLNEAKWYSSGYTPTLQEYLNNAWISISAPLILVHAYFFVTNPINREDLDCLDTYHHIIRCSAMILRLANDLGTSSVCIAFYLIFISQFKN